MEPTFDVSMYVRSWVPWTPMTTASDSRVPPRIYANAAKRTGVWSPEFGVTRMTPLCTSGPVLDSINFRVLLWGIVYENELKPDVTVPTGTAIVFPEESVKLTVPDTGGVI